MKRICAICGKPVTAGMTNQCEDFFVHEGECFEKYIDETYGKHSWMSVNDDSEGGYYIVTDDSAPCGYFGTGIYYTEWEDEEMTRNSFLTTLTIRRIDICDLMLACLAAKRCANDGGEKWDKLHRTLKSHLNSLDAQLDALIYATEVD